MLEQTMGIYGNIRYISNQNGIYIPTYPYNPHMIHYEDCIWGLWICGEVPQNMGI
jgi:hypothetical protein